MRRILHCRILEVTAPLFLSDPYISGTLLQALLKWQWLQKSSASRDDDDSFHLSSQACLLLRLRTLLEAKKYMGQKQATNSFLKLAHSCFKSVANEVYHFFWGKKKPLIKGESIKRKPLELLKTQCLKITVIGLINHLNW